MATGGAAESNAGQGGAQASAADTGMVSGRVVDENGTRMKGVRVTVDEQSVETNDAGEFEVRGAMARKQARVDVEAPRHAKTTSPTSVEAGKTTKLTVTTTRASRVRLTSAKQGGTASNADGAKLKLPPAGLRRKKDGSVAAEAADVEMAQPSTPAAMRGAPGGLRMRTSNGKSAQLEALGMLSVRAFDATGELELSQQQARLTLPLLAGAPLQEGELSEVFRFDEDEGTWKKHGDALVQGGVVDVDIDLLGWYMVGHVMLSGCVRGSLAQADKSPGAFVGLAATGRDYLGLSSATTVGDGSFCIDARIGSTLALEASDSWFQLLELGTDEGSCEGGDLCADIGTLDAVSTPACDPAVCAAPDVGQACCDSLAGTCTSDIGFGCGESAPFSYVPPSGSGGTSGTGGSSTGGSSSGSGGVAGGTGGAAGGSTGGGGSTAGSGGSSAGVAGSSSGGVGGSSSGGVGGSGSGGVGGSGSGGVGGSSSGGSSSGGTGGA